MKNSQLHSPREIIDKQEQALAEKHQKRLDEMLTLALNQSTNEHEAAVKTQAIVETQLNGLLNKKSVSLEEKYQQRLDIMIQAAVSHQKTTDYLDNKAYALSQKHQQRLAQITRQALSPQPSISLLSRCKHFVDSILTPAPMMALASIFAISVALSLYFESQTKQVTPDYLQASAKLPAWVKDTDVPLELLENMDFYVWLSQQDNYAKAENKLILATAWYNQFGAGKRRAPRNTTQGVFRAAPYTGKF